MRLFIAIKIPDNQLYELSHLPPSTRGIKRVPDNNRHLTLQFLGEQNEQSYHEIIETLSNINFTQFSLKICNTGFFNHKGKGLVLWAGIEQNENLESLQRTISNILKEQLNLIPDKKNYKPHITLGRTKSRIKEKDLIPFLSSGLYDNTPFIVKSFSLFSSQLNPEGAIYSEEETFFLEPSDEE